MAGLDEVYHQALGVGARPFQFQRRIAEQGFPEVLDVPTGAGKTPAMLLAWLYRRCLHDDVSVRTSTPTRLIWCLPLRTLTTQTVALAHRWTASLGLAADVDVHLLMGGEPVPEQRWRLDPQRPTIIVSTLDMALSRALNRGYLASRYAWPIDFALFNDDCHWVFDEVQLMGTALSTSRQLHGLRTQLGVPTRHSSTWMSATVGNVPFSTIDAPDVGAAVRLSAEDLADPGLSTRLEASKRLIARRVEDPKRYPAGFAAVVRSEHIPGTTTLAVLNSVRNARDTAEALWRRGSPDGPEIVLLHSRFRPPDRAAAMERALSTDRGEAGRIVVATQVIEAGVDMSATTLVTECAPWSSIVQRAGRCNRWGTDTDARVVVVGSSAIGPYEAEPIEASWTEVGRHDGDVMTPESMAAIRVAEPAPVEIVLRRKDLLELFDTSADLSGNDIDVSRFIRADGDVDLTVAWRQFDTDADAESWPAISRDEGCPVPVGEARTWLKGSFDRARTFDPLTARWRPLRIDDLRPGGRVVVDSTLGGYDPMKGFSSRINDEVQPIATTVEGSAPSPDDDLAVSSDPLTTDVAGPVSLAQHLTDAELAAAELCDQLGVDDVYRAAITCAARLHDLGKAHDAFQGALHRCAPDVEPSVVLAKSGGRQPLRYDDNTRRGFRHELVSALVLLTQPELVGTGTDADLVTYLVGAHHGRIRLGVRSLPGEDARTILGVRDGDEMPAVDLGTGTSSAPTALSLDPLALGSAGAPSWSARALDLLDRHGPFRLAWLEALVRIADWRASIEGSQR